MVRLISQWLGQWGQKRLVLWWPEEQLNKQSELQGLSM